MSHICQSQRNRRITPNRNLCWLDAEQGKHEGISRCRTRDRRCRAAVSRAITTTVCVELLMLQGIWSFLSKVLTVNPLRQHQHREQNWDNQKIILSIPEVGPHCSKFGCRMFGPRWSRPMFVASLHGRLLVNVFPSMWKPLGRERDQALTNTEG